MESNNKQLNIGVLLPHTQLYGGVKRFLEIGNVVVKMGHQFTIFTHEGFSPEWFPYMGEVRIFDDLKSENFDLIIFCQTRYLDLVLNSTARRKVFYLINPKLKIRNVVKCDGIEIFANSTGIRNTIFKKYKVSSFPAYGGINLSNFQYREPVEKELNNPFVIMAYGRISKRKKGTMEVVKACERIYKKGANIRLLLFDSPTDKKAEKAIEEFSTSVPYDFVLNHPVNDNQALYHRADIFVSAELSGGWSNTSAEAMACGTPLIATNVGTLDFLTHLETGYLLKNGKARQIEKALLMLMSDFELRKRLSLKGRECIERFDWGELTHKIMNHLNESEFVTT
jgi:glycosyltransferase involved in cell wall biosynthesis